MYKKNNAINLQAIEKYFQTNVLANNAFCCQYEHDCESSYLETGEQDVNRQFYKGQLHHIGTHYDLSYQQTPFRVMIVGQEYGHAPSLVDFKARYEMLMDSAAIGYKSRNPHMKGTSSLLRLLHDLPLGNDREGEFIQVDGKAIHLFDTFVLANYLLCSAVTEGSRQGKAAWEMKKNCANHFVATLELLKPTILLVQGKSFWDYPIKDLFDRGLEQLEDQLYQANFKGNPLLIAVFAHPSAPAYGFWGNSLASKYLLNTVKPTVEHLREVILAEHVRV